MEHTVRTYTKAPVRREIFAYLPDKTSVTLPKSHERMDLQAVRCMALMKSKRVENNATDVVNSRKKQGRYILYQRLKRPSVA